MSTGMFRAGNVIYGYTVFGSCDSACIERGLVQAGFRCEGPRCVRGHARIYFDDEGLSLQAASVEDLAHLYVVARRVARTCCSNIEDSVYAETYVCARNLRDVFRSVFEAWLERVLRDYPMLYPAWIGGRLDAKFVYRPGTEDETYIRVGLSPVVPTAVHTPASMDCLAVWVESVNGMLEPMLLCLRWGLEIAALVPRLYRGR